MNTNQFFIKDIEVKSVNGIPAVTRALRHFLAYNDMIPLRPMLQSVIQELLINALKANQKRAFFEEKGLDFINQYVEGNSRFVKIIKENNLVHEIPEDSHYNVLISFKSNHEKSQIIIENNSEMHPLEKEKVKEKLNKGKELNDLTDIIENHNDSSEGAGIGLVMSSILLKNAGFSENCLNFSSEKGITRFSIEIPVSLHSTTLDDRDAPINHYLNSSEFLLPVLNESIEKLSSLPDRSRFDKIREILLDDPALLANVLRISAPHLYKNRIIERAIRKTGKNLILNNVRSIQINETTKNNLKALNRAAKSVADLCHAISNIFDIHRGSDHPYIAGIMHNIGSNLIYTLDREDLIHLSQLMGHDFTNDHFSEGNNKNIEKISSSLNNAKLGWILTRIWNFPGNIPQTILHQNHPEGAPEHSIQMAGILYLAKSIHAIKENTIKWDDLNFDFIQNIGLGDPNELKIIFNKFISS
ncbi:MAG: HDOD domain-containing protein [Spirochaetia bacterium]|nr:HDOD domain-containing protein [Spirochaetia bacterium]